ncbi:DeoR/GlpR family DNA-binding transcription regulator [Serinibacter arcticus]|uniref:Lactose phosphotransferase system repressor n=1 Tax=Serinibacter arcticus TaxID=1655435 RepID=A0A4Z1E0N7_9MICO|nr:DeoR/GlpR family DNA-binding transcription regulator [Serinibacter arcticus]TGO04212.1 Transcriptional regulatory protein [Serinibacter arcticus]
MLTAERRAHLLSVLARDGKVLAKVVAADLGLSEDTIRRDLRDLAEEGLLQRVYGGALPAAPAAQPYLARTTLATASKERVARTAVALIEPGATVVLDGGTTALALARALPASLRATILTPSPSVAVALAETTAVEIVMLGGVVHRHSLVVGGALAAEQIARVRADVFLLGVTGVSAAAGLTTGEVEDAATKRALAARSAQTWVLASAEKIGAASAHDVLPLAEVAGVVSDGEDHPELRALRRAGVTVL